MTDELRRPTQTRGDPRENPNPTIRLMHSPCPLSLKPFPLVCTDPQVSGELSAARKAVRAISERLRAFPPRDLPQRLPPRRSGPSLPLPPPPPPAPSRAPLLASAPAALSLPRLENSMAALPMSLPLLSLAALGVPAGGDVLFRILFSAARIGALIGKGGTTIKQLRVDTRTRITVEPPVDGCEEQVVEIQGPEVRQGEAHRVDERSIRLSVCGRSGLLLRKQGAAGFVACDC